VACTQAQVSYNGSGWEDGGFSVVACTQAQVSYNLLSNSYLL
jgi:hypothetical protein